MGNQIDGLSMARDRAIESDALSYMIFDAYGQLEGTQLSEFFMGGWAMMYDSCIGEDIESA